MDTYLGNKFNLYEFNKAIYSYVLDGGYTSEDLKVLGAIAESIAYVLYAGYMGVSEGIQNFRELVAEVYPKLTNRITNMFANFYG